MKLQTCMWNGRVSLLIIEFICYHADSISRRTLSATATKTAPTAKLHKSVAATQKSQKNSSSTNWSTPKYVHRPPTPLFHRRQGTKVLESAVASTTKMRRKRRLNQQLPSHRNAPKAITVQARTTGRAALTPRRFSGRSGMMSAPLRAW